MTSRSRALRWIAPAATSLFIAVTLSSPQHLPRPLRWGLNTAVDGAARVWLWSWDEPYNTPDAPPVEFRGAADASPGAGSPSAAGRMITRELVSLNVPTPRLPLTR